MVTRKNITKNSPNEKIELSIVLPTYNEKDNIPILFERLQKTLKNIPYEIIVADDNSPDGTWKLVEEISETQENIHLLRRMSNKGLSPAVMDGLAIAKGSYAVIMDADLQHDEKIIPKMLEQLKAGNELVVGSRKVDGGGIENWAWHRRFISWGATFLAQIFLGRSVNDPMSGFFALNMNFFARVSEKVNPRGFKILLEFLNLCDKNKVTEVGFIFQSRQFGESKLSGGVMFNYLIGLFDLKFGKLLPANFIKFALVGLSGVFVNQGVLFLGEKFLWQHTSNLNYNLMLAIEVSIIWNFIINNFWTFREQAKRTLGSFIKGLLYFNLICLAGALINYAVAMYLTNHTPLNIYWANLVGIALATFWNFFLNTNITWRKK